MVLIAGNIFLWIEVILLQESSVGGDIFVERINDLQEKVSELKVLFVHPQLLVGEFTLVIGIWVLCSQLLLDGGLQIYFGIGLEKVREQLLLDSVDFLVRSDTLLEDW